MLLGVVEGLTEFLPISSTGHLIVVSHLAGFEGRRAEVFQIFIQLGAILSVVWEYSQGAAALEGLSLAVGVAVARALQRCGVPPVQLQQLALQVRECRRPGGESAQHTRHMVGWIAPADSPVLLADHEPLAPEAG